MQNLTENYIDGQWVASGGSRTVDVINPATEQSIGQLTLGSAEDVDRAAQAAQRAFATWSLTSREERVALLERLLSEFDQRADELANAITEEMGAPPHLSTAAQCGLITPWNVPASVIATKIVPALATGCTVVLKPSEYSPYSARLIAEMIHDAGYPAGVFNLVYGDGETVGNAISGHPSIDMVSITGSTRAGIAVAVNAAQTVKRVHQELGGKSANVILPSADIDDAVQRGVKFLMWNSGQGCSLPSRMIVPRAKLDVVKEAVRKVESEIQPGPVGSNAYLGPVVNKNQFDSIQKLIESGIAEGATVVIGGPGKPEGLSTGYYVRPTVFVDTTPDMRIVREEIFGPVLVIQTYDDVDEAVRLAEDTQYGLAAYVEAGTLEEAREIGLRLTAGQVYLNGAELDQAAPFGGFKQSGNGREWGPYAFEAFLEPKALLGYQPAE